MRNERPGKSAPDEAGTSFSSYTRTLIASMLA